MPPKSNRKRIASAIRTLRESQKCPRGYIWFSYHKCKVWLTPRYRRGNVSIGFICVDDDHEGKGHGGRALRAICKWADKHLITLTLYVGSSGALSNTALRRWYRSYGFKGNGQMKRIPFCTNR